VCEVIAFRYFDDDAAEPVQVNRTVELAYRLDVNEYAGSELLQLVVENLTVLPA
jgi:hypothetical protein